ncbi:hypothetical protein [Muribaculum intestinale]|uniref:hypothetical protein n=1 Tax=Muribaculum intestinale TaxID=1796646 RepID=UPI0025B2FA64|nr:hypothetical protein [Muribaculum intestinale]
MNIEEFVAGLDIASTLDLNSSSRLQTFYDTALKGYETTDLETDGFTNAPIKLNSEVEFAEAKKYLRGMATYTSEDSEPIARGREAELTKWSESIPTIRYAVKLGKDDYKNRLLAAQDSVFSAVLESNGRKGNVARQSLRDYLIRTTTEDLRAFPESTVASLNYQCGQMLSKRGLYITRENNPDGIVGVKFESRVPEGNVTKEKWYTVKADGSLEYVTTVNPIMTLKKKIRELRMDQYNGYTNVRVEMNYRTFFRMLEHPEVLEMIGNPNKELAILVAGLSKNTAASAKAQDVGRNQLLEWSDAAAVAWFKSAVGADEVKLHTAVVGVDKLDGTTKRYKTKKLNVFEEGVVLLRPTGNIGIIQPVQVIRPDKEYVYANFMNGWGIIEYFYDGRQKTQEWISEVSFLAVPTCPSDLYYVEVEEIASGSTTTRAKSA